jgi:NAD(P)-dependent dehydrogenase (short-subunit alcohol dehydrogenase family)
MTKRISLRLIKDNIAVSSIAPGAFASEMNRQARDEGEESVNRALNMFMNVNVGANANAHTQRIDFGVRNSIVGSACAALF